MRKLVWFFLPLLLLEGCNIFNPGDNRQGKMTADAWILEGQKRIRTNEPELALAAFETAAGIDSGKTEALYGIAKVSFIQARFNIFTLLNAFDETEQSLPFITWSLDSLNILYLAVQKAKPPLGKIIDSVGTDMKVKPNWVRLDYATIASIYIVLRLRDFDGNGIINADDNPIKMLGISVDQNGLHIKNLDSLLANPQQFNAFLDNTANFVTEVNDDIDRVMGDRLTGQQEEAFEDVVDNVADKLPYYKIGDGFDNDGDGKVDEEIRNGRDDDDDGLIDEDSQATALPKIQGRVAS